MINAMIIDGKDNVAVVIEPVKKGDTVSYVDMDKKTVTFTAIEDVQIYHKIAIKDIPADEPVVKYGEHIAREIKQGEHVHEHNVKAVRENLG
mgnify:CR=1 FL=1